MFFLSPLLIFLTSLKFDPKCLLHMCLYLASVSSSLIISLPSLFYLFWLCSYISFVSLCFGLESCFSYFLKKLFFLKILHFFLCLYMFGFFVFLFCLCF